MKKSLFFGAILLSAALIIGCASTDQEEVVVKSEKPSLHLLILQGRTEDAKDLFFTKINVNELDASFVLVPKPICGIITTESCLNIIQPAIS